MRPSALTSLCVTASILLASASSLLAQTTATTDPVGFITLNVAGTGGVGTNKISFAGLGLTRPVEYQGSAETAAGSSLTDNEATWTDNQFNGVNGKFFVEITEIGGSTTANGVGATYDIATTVAGTKTITTVQPLVGVSSGVKFRVRKHWTVGSVFGAANESGLTGGADASAADQLMLWNGTGFDAYYYQSGSPIGGTGWRSPNDIFADAAPTVIYPEDGVVVRRIGTSGVNVVLMGAVKMGQTSVPVQPGTNVVSNVYASGMTLASSGLQASGIAGGADSANADQVLIWNGTGYSAYYYQTGAPLGGTGWRSPSDVFADAGPTAIPVGSSLVVKRTNGAAFNWKLPQHPASL